MIFYFEDITDLFISNSIMIYYGYQGAKNMTELLYQTDSYLREFDAEVVRVDREKNAIQLNRTAFIREEVASLMIPER